LLWRESSKDGLLHGHQWFWQLVESSRRGFDPTRADGNRERQRGAFRKLLLKLPPEEVIEFRNHVFDLMNVAFRWELWGAAYIIVTPGHRGCTGCRGCVLRGIPRGASSRL
jgi:hypothetical protein